MSNTVFLIATEFVSFTKNGDICDASYGYRICDNYDSAYDNHMSESEFLGLDQEKLVMYAEENGGTIVRDMLESVGEGYSTLYVMDEMYDLANMCPAFEDLDEVCSTVRNAVLDEGEG